MRALILLLLISSYSYGNGNHSENSHGANESDSSAVTNVVTGGNDSNASNIVIIRNGGGDSADEVSGGVSGTNGGSNENAYRNIKIDYDNIPANSAPNLTVAYCVEGITGQSDRGGLVIAGSDTVCRQTRIIGAALPEIMRLNNRGSFTRADEMSEDITLMVEKMIDDEGFRSWADKSWTAFKAVGGWVILALLL